MLARFNKSQAPARTNIHIILYNPDSCIYNVLKKDEIENLLLTSMPEIKFNEDEMHTFNNGHQLKLFLDTRELTFDQNYFHSSSASIYFYDLKNNS